MSSDPVRAPKPRLPKAYTDPELTFLKSHLPEFDRRSQGVVRGDAKRFALERASEFIARFGIPQEFIGVVGEEDSKTRFREQIYNWFKNTVGRNRRKQEGRPRPSKKSIDKGQSPSNLAWNPAPTSLNHYSPPGSSASASSPVTPLQPQIVPAAPYATIQQPPQPLASAPPHLNINITQATLRGALLQGVDASTLASMIQNFVLSAPGSSTPLTAVIGALFEAISSDTNSNRNPHAYLRRFLDASAYFPPSIIHAGVSGPFAGPRALQMHIRKFSIWIPACTSAQNQNTAASTSIADEMQRIASDRQRRKDHIQWANIHAAALELGVMGMGHVGESENSGYGYAMGRAFSEMMARDAVWESDEVEWVAGICVLRAVIRTAIRGDRRQRDEYDELLKTYEGRWKEIKDEARQALVTEVLLAAKDDLARLDDNLT